MVKGEITKEQGNKWDNAQTLVARITWYKSPHEGLYRAIAEDARNSMDLENGISYHHGVVGYSEVTNIINEIRQHLKNWLRSNPEVNQERQNARNQFHEENWHRAREAEERLAVDNPSIVIQLRDLRQKRDNDLHHAQRQRLEQRRPERRLEQIPEQQQTPLQRWKRSILRRLCLDPSQPEQRIRPQWHGQQRPEQQRRRQQIPEQQRHEQRHELQEQLQRWKRSILRRLCCSTEQVDAMKPAQLHKYARELERRAQKLSLDQPMRSGTVLEQRERRKLEQYKQEADNLHQRVNYLSRQGRLVGSEPQHLDNATIIATKVTLLIDNRLLKNLEQQLPEGTTPGQLDRTRLGQLRKEAEQLRQRQQIPEQFHLMPRGEQDQRSPRQLMRNFRRQNNDIKDKADEIITKLRRLELPAMNPAQLNQYAGELEQEVWKQPERTNQNQGELEQLMTRALDVQEHMQQQEHVQQQGQARVEWGNLLSAGHKVSRSIELIADRLRRPEQRVERMNLRDMEPVQLDLYAKKQLPEGTNLGQQNQGNLEQLEEKALQLREEIRRRQDGLVAMDMQDIYYLPYIRGIADKVIRSAGDNLKQLEQRKLGAMSSAALNRYAHGLEQEVRQLSERTNLGQREPRKREKLQKKARLLKNEVTQRLESEQDWSDRIILESAGRKASRSIELISR